MQTANIKNISQITEYAQACGKEDFSTLKLNTNDVIAVCCDALKDSGLAGLHDSITIANSKDFDDNCPFFSDPDFGLFYKIKPQQEITRFLISVVGYYKRKIEEVPKNYDSCTYMNDCHNLMQHMIHSIFVLHPNATPELLDNFLKVRVHSNTHLYLPLTSFT